MKLRSFVIFFLLLGVLPDVLIAAVLLRGIPLWAKGLICLPTLAVLILLPMIASGFRYTPAVRTTSYLTFLFQLPKTLFALVYLCSRSLWGALVPALAVAGFFFSLIFIVSKRLKVNRLEIALKDLPKAFDGLRICQLSDLHLGSFGGGHGYVRRVVAEAGALAPDVIFFTGDLVNFQSSDAVSYKEDLAALKAPLGIFAIRGNHDYMHHGPFSGDERSADLLRLKQLEESLGWKLLLDEHVILERDGGRLAVAGVENTSANPLFGGGGGDLEKALEGIPAGMFILLLSHDPSHWRSEIVPDGRAGLTLSGHTHGLKYKLAGLRPQYWRLHESSGVYREGSQVLHVSPGLGSSFAFRLGGRPCIDLITLKSESI